MKDFSFGSCLLSLRKAAGLTQLQLAKELGISYQAVSKWENGLSNPDLVFIPPLADLLGVSIDTLFGRETRAGLENTAVTKESGTATPQLPWPDDNTLYAALFQGHQPLDDQHVACLGQKDRIRFIYSGPALNVSSQLDLSCEYCDIRGSLRAGGDITVRGGGVEGSVTAGGNVNCLGIEGSVTAGGAVNCGDITGSLQAQGDVNCGDVGGNVESSGHVECGDVGGDVIAGSCESAEEF